MPVLLRIARHHTLIVMHGQLRQNATHSHHAMQAIWAAPTDAQLSAAGALHPGSQLVEGRTPHALSLSEGVVCLIERHSSLAQRLRRGWLGESAVAGLPMGPHKPTLETAAGWLADLAQSVAAPEPLDARVSGTLEWLDELEGAGRWHEVTLEAAIAQAHLSQSRFLHLFSAQMGTPWRAYLVWRRALVAVTLAAGGADLTTAAHGAGYADSAHLSRQFKALFGLTPSAALHNSQFVQV